MSRHVTELNCNLPCLACTPGCTPGMHTWLHSATLHLCMVMVMMMMGHISQQAGRWLAGLLASL